MSDQAEFINFVLAIPKDQNPYIILKEYLAELIVPIVPKWYPLLLGLNFCLLAFAMLQSSFILYVLTTTRKFSLVTTAPLGLWKVDTVSATAILAWIYCFLATLETLSEEFSRHGHYALPLGWQYMISPFKFIFLYWISFRLSSKIAPGFDNQLARSSNFCSKLNSAFVVPLIIMSISVTWACVGLYDGMAKVEADYRQLVRNLIRASMSFDPNTYTPTSLFRILLSSKSFLTAKIVLVRSLDCLNWIFLIWHAALAICYVPILIVSLRDLEQKSKLFTSLTVPGNVNCEEWHTVCTLVKKTKSALTFRSFAILIEQIFWFPSIIWYRLGLRHGVDFLKDARNFWIGRMVTLTFPLISLN
ncbi:hypothetical protein O181_038432, partial [Austropuccinia psidii MF-1]|nr:hypothetical protein [Austropuccinia psidii MF-1]